jgi:hypothetical protein
MNQDLIAIAKRLQACIHAADPAKDRDSLVWALGFLTALLNSIETRIDERAGHLAGIGASLDKARRVLAELEEKNRHRFGEDSDSLGEIAKELDDFGPDDAPVPARRKPGPNGRTGGAAVRPGGGEVQ